MKKILALFVLICATSMYPQEKGVIRGNIVDLESFGESLPMADVHIKNTDFKTSTNFNGNFEINNPPLGSYTMVVSFLGYETLELSIEVKENSFIEVHLGLKAQSISLMDITTLVSNQNEIESPLASLEKGEKE